MGKSYDGITPELSNWIEQQRIFFVATAPLAGDGFINCSPKGMDTFRILGPRDVAYVDLTGSGVETIAHARKNGRIVYMFCPSRGRRRSSGYTEGARPLCRTRRGSGPSRHTFPRISVIARSSVRS